MTESMSTGAGHYSVTFDRSLAGCVATADYYVDGLSGPNVANHFSINHVPDVPSMLHVGIYNSALAKSFGVDFSLIVVC